MSQPSERALNPDPTWVRKDRRGRLMAWRRGRRVRVPTDVRELVDAGHDLGDIWARLECFGGGVKALPWVLHGREPRRRLFPRR